jgi:hypothetical protein
MLATYGRDFFSSCFLRARAPAFLEELSAISCTSSWALEVFEKLWRPSETERLSDTHTQTHYGKNTDDFLVFFLLAFL